jgi:hypothetical protein
MSQYLMYLNWWHRNASSAALLSNISNILSWRKPYYGASLGASHVSRDGARAVRAPSLALSWSKLTYTLTHMNATVKYIRPSFIHACRYIYSTFYIHIYRYIIAPFVIRLILLYINWVYTSCLLHFEYCAAPIVLTSGFGAHTYCATHIHTALSHGYVIIISTNIHPTHQYQCHILLIGCSYCTTHSDSTIRI